MHDAACRLDFFLRHPTIRLGHVPHNEECRLKEYGLALSAWYLATDANIARIEPAADIDSYNEADDRVQERQQDPQQQAEQTANDFAGPVQRMNPWIIFLSLLRPQWIDWR
jgi:hypothetical protein